MVVWLSLLPVLQIPMMLALGVVMASPVNQLPIAAARPIVVPISVAVLVMLVLPQSPTTPAPLPPVLAKVVPIVVASLSQVPIQVVSHVYVMTVPTGFLTLPVPFVPIKIVVLVPIPMLTQVAARPLPAFPMAVRLPPALVLPATMAAGPMLPVLYLLITPVLLRLVSMQAALIVVAQLFLELILVFGMLSLVTVLTTAWV